MLHRFIGRAGSGKTTYWMDALKTEYNRGSECIVIVPEQQSVDMEKRICTELGNGFNMKAEVLNFERLPNRVRRDYGGFNKKHLDTAAESLLFALAIEKASVSLKEYGKSVGDIDFIKRAAHTVNALKKDGFDIEKLKTAVSSIDSTYEKRLAAKLGDIACIYEAYTELTVGDFSSSTDELSSLAEDLPQMPFFRSKAVFIDGYYTFTEAEYAILREIIATSDEVYMTFLYCEEDRKLFEPNRLALERTKEYANGLCDDVILGDNKRASNNALLHIDKNLRRRSEYKPEANGAVEIYSCDNIYTESVFVSSLISKLVAEGYRYKDITIAVRNTESYSGILDITLERYGIPVYSGKKDNLATKSLSSFILSCLEIAHTNYSYASMEKYIKCGYSSLNERETRDLLSYMNTWNIRGKQWCTGDWAMNPDGYTERFEAKCEKRLAAVNAARQKLIEPLSPLIDTLRQSGLTVSSAVEAIYGHLVELDIAKKLALRAQTLNNASMYGEASKLSLMYETLIKIFDTLHTVCGDMPITVKKLSQLFSLMLDGYTIGAIPTSADRVNISSASLMRPQDCKVMIAVGVNDGVFPAAPSEEGLFGERERKFLTKLGITVEKPSDAVTAEEWLTFYTVCTYPSDKLILTYCAADMKDSSIRASQGILRIQSLFSNLEAVVPTEAELCMSKNVALDMIQCLTDTGLKKYLEKYFAYKEETAKPFHDTDAKIAPTSAPTIYLSPSHIQTYSLCPFSYFAKYSLGLKEEKRAEISHLEIGNFVHTLLGMFIKVRFATGSFVALEGAELEAEAERLVNECADNVFSGLREVPPRIRHSIARLKRSVYYLFSNICTEFDGSGFVPVGYEMPISGKKGRYVEFNEMGKPTVLMDGYIDRIDSYRSPDGKEYIKIVDYKSSEHSISRELLKDGMDIQMLAYLRSYLEALNDENTASGAVLYMPVLLGEITAKNGITEKEIEKAFKRKGVIDGSDAVREAFGANEKIILPSRTNVHSKDSYVTAEVFKELQKTVADVITSTGEKISSGCMDILPYTKELNNHNPCKNCIARSMCRKGAAEWIV